MPNSGQNKNRADIHSFEGMWLLSPGGIVACAEVIKGKLLIPFSFSGKDKLSGHFYDCHLKGEKLFCRFEHFDSAESGALFLAAGLNQTLTAGQWTHDKIPPTILKDISTLSESLPGRQAVVWVRILDAPTPSWAEKYFSEDWPNKGTI